MSVSLILIPAALAAVSAIGAAGTAGILSLGTTRDDASVDPAEGARPIAVRTRMKDPDLLGEALADLGAVDVSVSGDAITAVVDGVEITMARTPDAVWGAHFARQDGHDMSETDAADLVGRLDAAYAVRVQHAVAERIRTRAGTAGFELVSETRDDDDTITMVLGVKDYA